MQAIINAGGAVLYQNEILTQIADLPTQAEIDALPASIYDTSKQTIYVPASAMTAATTAGAASASLESTTNAVNYAVLDFDATVDEYAHFNVSFPEKWNKGTLTFQVLWSTDATDTDGVAWGLQAVFVPDDSAIDTAYGTPVVVTDAAQSAAGEINVTSESTPVTIAGTIGASGMVFFRLFRDVSDAADTMTEDARLIGIKVFYNVTQL